MSGFDHALLPWVGYLVGDTLWYFGRKIVSGNISV